MISVSIFFWIFWSISVHSLPGDYFPPKAVASVYGIAGTGSTIGSIHGEFQIALKSRRLRAASIGPCAI